MKAAPLAWVPFALTLTLACGSSPAPSPGLNWVGPGAPVSRPEPPPRCQVADLDAALRCDLLQFPEASDSGAQATLGAQCEQEHLSEQWSSCAETCLAALENDPRNENAETWADHHLACFHERASLVGRPGRSRNQESDLVGDQQRFAAQELGAEARRIERVYRFVACHRPDSQFGLIALYRVAREWYRHNRFDLAATAFEAVVDRNPNAELAEFAVSLFIDSLIVRGRQEPRVENECIERLRSRATHYEPMFCSRAPNGACSTLRPLLCGFTERDADDAVERGDYATASRIFEALCGDCDPERSEEWLFNALHMAREAGETERAARLERWFRARHPESELLDE